MREFRSIFLSSTLLVSWFRAKAVKPSSVASEAAGAADASNTLQSCAPNVAKQNYENVNAIVEGKVRDALHAW